MRCQDRKIRNSLRYKIKKWFYHLTFQDVKKATKISVSFLLEIFAVVLGFFLLFVLPAFFH